ncbi:hypothetical protein THAOC_05677, partial [Thalassiosira oceanica]
MPFYFHEQYYEGDGDARGADEANMASRHAKLLRFLERQLRADRILALTECDFWFLCDDVGLEPEYLCYDETQDARARGLTRIWERDWENNCYFLRDKEHRSGWVQVLAGPQTGRLTDLTADLTGSQDRSDRTVVDVVLPPGGLDGGDPYGIEVTLPSKDDKDGSVRARLTGALASIERLVGERVASVMTGDDDGREGAAAAEEGPQEDEPAESKIGTSASAHGPLDFFTDSDGSNRTPRDECHPATYIGTKEGT